MLAPVLPAAALTAAGCSAAGGGNVAGAADRGAPAATAPAGPTSKAAPPDGRPAADSQPAGRDPRDPRPVPRALSAYRPTYFIGGPSVPNVKFQFSIKFRLFSPDSPAAGRVPALSKLYFGYTQLGLWDLENPSQTTIDTTYMPELFFATHTTPYEDPRLGAAALGFQAGVQHESTGRAGPASRNVNYAYAQPTLFFGSRDGLSGEVGPRVRVYFSESEDNPEIEDYYGRVAVYAAVRFGPGLQIATTTRVGDGLKKGAVQVDVTYPIRRFLGGDVETYFHVQYFNGFAESLLDYREHHETVRAGISFVR